MRNHKETAVIHTKDSRHFAYIKVKCAYLVALNTALTLPDICGKAEFPGLGTIARYKKWYKEHIEQCEKLSNSVENMPYLSADVVY